MFVRNACFGLLALVLFNHSEGIAAGKATRGVQFKSNPTPLTAEATKPFSVALRTLLSNTGSGNLTWSTLDPLPAWVTLNAAAETLTGNPAVSDAGTKSFRLAVQDADSGALSQVNLTVVVVPIWNQDPLNLGQLPERVPFSLDLRTKISFAGTGNLTFTVEGTLPGWLTLTPGGILSGTPQRADVGAFGGFNFVATAQIGGGTSKVAASGTVLKVLQPPSWKVDPVVLADAAEDFAYSQSVASQVNNPEGGSLTFSVVSGKPAWLTVSAAGQLTGTPTKPDVGPVSLQMRVSTVVDGQTLGANAAVNFRVNPTNHAPVWSADPINLPDALTWVPYSQNLAAFASDKDGNPLSFKIINGPAWLKLSANGTLAGTADRPDIGPNSWMVEVTDGTLTARTTVNVKVIKSNEPPKWLANPTVLPNGKEDSAYNQSLASFAVDPDNDTLTYTKVSGPAWASIAADGTVTGTPRGPDRGLNKFQVKVADGKAGEALTEVQIFVESTNHAPTWTQNPIRFTVAEKTAFTKTIADKAKDVDTGDQLKFFKLSGPAWASLSQAGLFSGTAPSDALGDNRFVVRVDDQKGGTADVDVIITVDNLNDPPFWTLNPVVLPNGPEKTAYIADLAPFAKDPDPGDTLTFIKVSGPAWASISTLGAFTGTPQRPDVGLNTFRVRIRDAGGLLAEVDVLMTVDKVNTPPRWIQNPIALANATEDSPYGTDAAKFAVDDDGDVLSYTLISGPGWLHITSDGKLTGTPHLADVGPFTAELEVNDGKAKARTIANGSVIMKNYPPEINQANLSFTVKERASLQVMLNDPKYVGDKNGDRLIFALIDASDFVQLSSNGDLFVNPLHKHIGDHALKFSVSDGVSTVPATLNIKVTRDALPPVWAQNPIRFTTPARVPFTATVADKVTDPDNSPLTFQKKSGPAWMSVSATGALSGTPGDDAVGDNTFVVSAANDGNSADVTVIVKVTPKNHPPEINQANLAFTVKERATLSVKLTDPKYIKDLDADSLIFTLIDNKDFVTLSSNGDLFLSPAHKDVGTYALKFRVTDGKDPIEGLLNITVLRDAQAPVWSENPITFTTTARKPFLKTIADKVKELDNLPLTIVKKSGPAWLTIEANGRISGTPKDADIGTNNFVVTAKNDILETDVQLVITVLQGNKDPFWTQNPILLPNATAGKAYSQNVAGFAADPDNQPLTFSKVSGPDWLNVATTGQLIGTPDISHVGPNSFVVRVTDPDGAFADATVQITVEKPNRPPRWLQDPVQLGDAFSEKPFGFALSAKAVDDDGDILTFKLINGPAWMTVAADGTLAGTPATADIGDYTAVFEVSDGKLTVQAGGVGRVLRKNDPPVINQPNLAFTVKERQVFVVNLNDPNFVSDPEGDALTFTLLDSASWVSLTPAGELTLKPLHPQIGDHVFRFKVSDGKLAVEGKLNVKVIRDPQPPEWLQNPVKFQATVRQPFSATLADKVKDPDGQPVTFTKKSGPAWLTIGPGGALSGTPQDVDLGDNMFVVTVANDSLGADAQVIVTVISDNKPPFWTQDPIALPDAKPNLTYSQSLVAFAKDPENERLTFEKISGPSWAFLTTGGLVIGTPADSDKGMNTLMVRVKDPHNAFADATVQIVVDAGGGGNHAPEWLQKPLNLGNARIDTAFSFDLTKWVKDVDGDPLTFKAISGPTWLFVSTGGQVSGIPRLKDLGPFTAIFEVSDGKASARVDAFGKVVDGTNKPPEIKPEALSFIVKERQVFIVDINKPQYVVDPEGDPLTFQLIDSVDWISLTDKGMLTISARHEHIGDHTYTVRISDDKGSSVEGPLFVRVLKDTAPPKWLQDPIVFETNVNEPFNQDLSPFAEDPAGLPLTFSKKSGPSWLTIAANGKISGTPLTANIGDNNFVVTVANDSAGADTRLIIKVKQAAPITDTVQVDSAVPGAPSENVWVIDNSWPWLGQNWLINELKAKIGVFFQALDQAKLHYTDVYLSSDVNKWKGAPIKDSKGETLITWKDTDPVRSFRERLDGTHQTKCYSSPIWSMFLFYKMAPQLPMYHNGFFTAAVPNDVFILTKHSDYYRNFSKGTPQASWNAPEFADSFINFEKGEKQPYRISALAPECPKLLDPYPDEPGIQPVNNGRDNPYQTLVKKTNGSYYALDCNIKMEKVLNDYAQKVIFRAYVHAKNRIPLSKKPLDPSKIKLSIGNVAIPGNTGSPSDKWSYDAAKNEVVIRWDLIDMTTIKPGDMIRIEYTAS